MKASEIKIGSVYLAKVGGVTVKVKVTRIRVTHGGSTAYDVTNTTTGAKTAFYSAAKFRSEVPVEDRMTPTYKVGDRVVFVGPAYKNYSILAVGSCGVVTEAAGYSSTEMPSGVREELVTVRFDTIEQEQVVGVSRLKAVSTEEQVATAEEARSDRQAAATFGDVESRPITGLDVGPLGGVIAKSEQVKAMKSAEPPDLYPEEGEQSQDPTASTAAPSAGTTGAREDAPATDQTEEGEQCQDPIHPVGCVEPSKPAQEVAAHTATPVSTLAGRIASAQQGRQRGTQVAGMVPNEEQEEILAIAVERNLKVLVVGAGAGTGKTATLKMLEQTIPGRGQYTAFNAALVAEAKEKFKKCAVNTTHSLAFRTVGKLYAHRLPGKNNGVARMRSDQIARFLGIEPFTIILKGQGQSDEAGNPTDRVKVLQPAFLAGQVVVATQRFCQSADREISAKHFKYIDGIDQPHSYENNDRVKEYLIGAAKEAWRDLSDVNGKLPFSHDVYVKLWQLGEGDDRPVIASDYILLDEAQDTAPVFLDILKQQTHALLVFVGDSNQAIYEWRGAVDAMKAYPDAPRKLLSQSYRFGQAIADVANTILRELEEPTDLVMSGMPSIPSRVAPVAEPRCYLYRTNAGAIGRVMIAVGEGKRPFLLGNIAEAISFCQAALDLQAKRPTSHPDLGCFSDWEEVEEYAGTDEGADLKLMVKLVNTFGAQEIIDALKNMPKEEDADLVVSTAHKSKGREWETVRLGTDFPPANRMTDPDIRLLYVAATRAKLTLDVSECPPFCGCEAKSYEGPGGQRGEGGWIPGLKIKYTKPMPTQEEQDDWLDARRHDAEKTKLKLVDQDPNTGREVSREPQKMFEAKYSTQAQREMADVRREENKSKSPVFNGTFTWTKFSDKWCIRGPVGCTVGARVRVVRKDGSSAEVTIKEVVKKFNDAWIYS